MGAGPARTGNGTRRIEHVGGARIIDGLREAVVANRFRVTLDGETWLRVRPDAGRNCGTCSFFHERGPARGLDPLLCAAGDCRRHAPPWPHAVNTDWCGDYVAIVESEGGETD